MQLCWGVRSFPPLRTGGRGMAFAWTGQTAHSPAFEGSARSGTRTRERLCASSGDDLRGGPGAPTRRLSQRRHAQLCTVSPARLNITLRGPGGQRCGGGRAVDPPWHMERSEERAIGNKGKAPSPNDHSTPVRRTDLIRARRPHHLPAGHETARRPPPLPMTGPPPPQTPGSPRPSGL